MICLIYCSFEDYNELVGGEEKEGVRKRTEKLGRDDIYEQERRK